MKKAVLLFVLFFVVAACGPVEKEKMSIISGKLLGYDGNPMLKAHVHLHQLLENSHRLCDVASDGSFEISFKGIGICRLMFTGVNHYAHTVSLWVEDPLLEKLTVRLKLYEYVDVFNDVKIIGDFNNFSDLSARPMARQEDGTFVFEMDTTVSNFAYQIVGADKDGWYPVNGTQSDDFIYDDSPVGFDDGVYRSVVKVSNGQVKIVFNPAKLLRGNPKDIAMVQFSNSNSLQAGFHAIYREYIHSERKKRLAGKDGLSYDWSEELTFYPKRIAAEKKPILRQALLVQYLQLSFRGMAGQELDERLIRQAFTEIPTTSLLWNDGRLMYFAAKLLSSEVQYDGYIDEALEKHPKSDVRAGILYYMLREAYDKDDSVNVRILFNRIVDEFGDTYWAKRARLFNPNPAIMAGKKLPTFSVASMDQPGSTYSNESMKGKIYLLDFWAIWCGPCTAELPYLHKVYEKYKDKNFEILSLSFDRSPDDVSKFRSKKWKMPWLHTFIGENFEGDIAKIFEVAGIPKPILVDGNTNTIIATQEELLGEQLDKTLADVFAEKTTRDVNKKE